MAVYKVQLYWDQLIHWLVHGNIYQAGLTYGSNQAITKITGKSPTENIKSFTDRKKSKIDEEQNYDEFIALVKNKIEKTSKIINLANQ